ncbi:MAG: hypothetical protein ACW98X_26545 [Promethearchaeota archaeon]|jgi:hypothetical protein
MIKPHLYLLPFKDNKYFKFGISITNNYNRITQHVRTYNVDTEKIIVVESVNKDYIRLIERNIMIMVEQTVGDDFVYKDEDGYTEIRSIDKWDNVMDVINTFKGSLELNVIKKPNIESNPNPVSYKTKPKKKKQKSYEKKNNQSELSRVGTALRNIKKYIIGFYEWGNSKEFITINLNLSSFSESEIEDFDELIMVGSFSFSGLFLETSLEYEYDLRNKTASITYRRLFPLQKGNRAGYEDIEIEYNILLNNFVNSFNRERRSNTRNEMLSQPHPYHLYMKYGGGRY